MKKTCYTCNYYGKCQLSVKVCNDWIKWDKKTITFNLDSFNGFWIMLHKKWYEKYPQQLMEDRKNAIQIYNDGKNETQIVNEMSQKIGEELLKELDKYATEEK